MNKIKIIFLIFFQLFFFKSIISREDSLIIQSTTSTRDSGFYNFILPKYKMIDDIEIKVIASGTGHAIVNAKKCDADIILVHDKQSEDLFVNNGFGLYRKDLMYNDFILVGPKSFNINF
ncbi:MAG: sulfate transporter, partial [Alphaproteobacteria bacterium]|nr:sulfate transporter [Alphaproteobacteria bacterium]